MAKPAVPESQAAAVEAVHMASWSWQNQAAVVAGPMTPVLQAMVVPVTLIPLPMVVPTNLTTPAEEGLMLTGEGWAFSSQSCLLVLLTRPEVQGWVGEAGVRQVPPPQLGLSGL